MTKSKAETIANLIVEAKIDIGALKAIKADGSVQICGDLYFQKDDTGYLGGLRGALVYTNKELEACADYGFGVPSFKNGNGDRSALITMKAAKAKSIEAMEAHIEFLKTL